MDDQIFEKIQKKFDQDTELRESLKKIVNELEQALTVTKVKLQKIHSIKSTEFPELVKSLEPNFATIREKLAPLKALELDVLYRLSGIWFHAMQVTSFVVALTVYLDRGELAGVDDVEKYLGVKVTVDNNPISEFRMSIEEYILGLLSLPNELSRLAINSVTAGNFELPKQISTFVNNLNMAFQQLNLKNDSLRRNFDAIKYDVKKIEEVIYDISVRSLGKRKDVPDSAN
ncbi:Translin-1 [Mycoemilia scoparia]|uniref:Translin-1 n=1 Tax=Mycoemilia scoparia TaxID=417184 RepID=A0A9W7ZN59_9FUNG|nr:Translin-1 [Mycoemilia scoparia]